MGQQIEIVERPMGARTVPTVAGRALHAALGSRAEFATWSRRQIERAKLQPETDFYREVFPVTHPSGAKHKTEVFLTISAAKRIAIVAGTERGCAVWESLLRIENPPKPNPPGFAALASRVVELEAEVGDLRAKARLYDVASNTTGWLTLQAAGKALGHGAVNFFERLRAAGMLLKDNTARQEHINAGRFKTVNGHYYDRKTGDRVAYVRTFISPKGMEFVAKQLEARSAAGQTGKGQTDAQRS